MVQVLRVNILLSTYNGEKYLSTQLDSLLAQDYPNFKIFIRDDGSSDNTVAIIKQYIKLSEKIIFLNDFENGEANNVGYIKSFLILLEESGEAEFYTFCDQDDFWHPNKISRGVEALISQNNSTPLLYSSSYWYCDESLETKGSFKQLPKHISFKDTFFYTTSFGFSMLINKKLRDIVLLAGKNHCVPHDSICERLATLFGKCIFDYEKTAKYRRHKKTVTYSGANKFKMVVKWFCNDIFGDVMKMYRKYATVIYDNYATHDGMSEENLYLLEIFREQKVTPILYFKRLFYFGRLRPTLGGELALRLCFLLSR